MAIVRFFTTSSWLTRTMSMRSTSIFNFSNNRCRLTTKTSRALSLSTTTNGLDVQHRSLHMKSVHFASATSSSSSSSSQLAKLRKKTGYAFSLCRKALEMHNHDLTQAEKWLRAEAIKQGWEKAQRVKSRATGEGLIGIYTSLDRSYAAMVEVKCETDFVAKNEHFIDLVSKLTRKLASQADSLLSGSVDIRDQQREMINKAWIVDERKLNEIAGDDITNTIQKLGENIRFVRGCIVRIGDGASGGTDTGSGIALIPYTHAVAGKIESKEANVSLGKYGTIIALQVLPKSSRTVIPGDDNHSNEVALDDDNNGVGLTSTNSIEILGTKLGQHIIGLSPQTVTNVTTEQNITTTSNSTVDDANRQLDGDGDEESTALLKQRFIFNDDITVEQFLDNSNAKVLDFVRFECGEDTTTSE